MTENIFIDGIQMKDIVNEAILFDMYYEDDKPSVGEERKTAPITDRTPQMQKFEIKNIVCNGAGRAISVQGLPEQFARNLEFKNIKISAIRGISCTDAENLKFSNVDILLGKGPVFDIDNARNITIDHITFTKDAALFMKVEGRLSEGLKLIGTDISKAKKDFELGKETAQKAVTQE
jgi:DNA sulfur modification protein DndE